MASAFQVVQFLAKQLDVKPNGVAAFEKEVLHARNRPGGVGMGAARRGHLEHSTLMEIGRRRARASLIPVTTWIE